MEEKLPNGLESLEHCIRRGSETSGIHIERPKPHLAPPSYSGFVGCSANITNYKAPQPFSKRASICAPPS